MKNILLRFMPIAAGLALLASPATSAPWPPVPGDVILGVQATGGTGSNVNVFFNLGPAHLLRDDGDQGVIANINDELEDAFGVNWFDRNDLFFGAIANFSGVDGGAPVNGDPTRTFYVSRGASSSGTAATWVGINSSALGSASTKLSGQYGIFAGITPTANQVGVLFSSDTVKWANSWTAWNPTPGAGYTVFTGGIQNSFGNLANVALVDLQRITPAATPGSPGTFEATIAISKTGNVMIGSSFFDVNPTTPVNGTVTGIDPDGETLPNGAVVNLTATPDSGYVFTGWTENGNPIGSNNPLAYAVSQNANLVANFAKDLTDPDGDGISTHDELVIHNTDPAIANTVPALPADIQFEGSLSAGLAGAEISAFDPASQRLFVTSGAGLQVISLANPAVPALLSVIDVSAAPINAVSNDISSVATSNGKVAVTVLNPNKEAAGHVVFLDAATAAPGAGLLSRVTVGIHPDMVAFTPDGTKALVANEGEYLNSNGGPGNTPGSVSIIDVATNGFANPIVNTVGFGAFDAQAAALKASGVRIFGNELPSNDLEPEFVAVSPDSTTAMISLQENNAVAILDIASATFTSIVPLGLKDFSTLLADFSDRDGPGATTISALTTGNPVFGLYMPDAIGVYEQNGQTFYVMANEGDDRDDFLAPDETSRVSALTLDGGTFPNTAALQNQAALGRLTVTKTGENGDALASPVTQLLALGGRSFTIRDAAGAIVYDSGDLIEKTVASYGKGGAEPIFDDTRSDNKGPEPEGIAVATINGVIYAFVGLERSNGVMVFNITDINNVTVKAFLRNAGDVSPEGIIVIPAVDSPNNRALVVISNEVSNSISVFSFDQDTTTDTDGNGFTDFEEQQLDALTKRFNVGDVVDIDLSFLLPGLTGAEKLAVVGLPKGLVFNALTGKITGKITGLLGEAPVEIRVLNGRTIVHRILYGMSVSPYQFVGAYIGLLEAGADPVGSVKVTVTAPGVYSAVLNLAGQTARSARGTFLDQTGNTGRLLNIQFAAGRGGNPAATAVNVSLTSAAVSDAVTGNREVNVNTLRGFRLSKPGRTPAATRNITVALSNTVPGNGVAVPAGTGYLAGTVDAKGLVKVTGFTGDAQAVSASFDLSQANQAVVWLQPYKNKGGFLGGVVTIGDLGLPSRGNTTTPPLVDGMKWLKAADATERAYPAGFPVQTLMAETSRWIAPPTAVAMGEALGLAFEEISVSYLNPLGVANLPTKFKLTPKFALLRIAPNVAVPWLKGSAASKTGTFTGTLTLPNGAGGVNGVLLQDASFGTTVGAGLVRVPLPANVVPKGSYQTIGIDLAQ